MVADFTLPTSLVGTNAWCIQHSPHDLPPPQWLLSGGCLSDLSWVMWMFEHKMASHPHLNPSYHTGDAYLLLPSQQVVHSHNMRPLFRQYVFSHSWLRCSTLQTFKPASNHVAAKRPARTAVRAYRFHTLEGTHRMLFGLASPAHFSQKQGYKSALTSVDRQLYSLAMNVWSRELILVASLRLTQNLTCSICSLGPQLGHPSTLVSVKLCITKV